MKAYTVLIGIMIFGIFIVGGTLLISEINLNYGFSGDTERLQQLDYLSNSEELGVEIGQNAEGTQDAITQEGISDTQKAEVTTKDFYRSLTDAPSLITKTAQILYIPEWLYKALIGILAIMLTYTLLVFIGLVRGGGG